MGGSANQRQKHKMLISFIMKLLNVSIFLRLSPFEERVVISLVSYPLSSPLILKTTKSAPIFVLSGYMCLSICSIWIKVISHGKIPAKEFHIQVYMYIYIYVTNKLTTNKTIKPFKEKMNNQQM